MLAADTQSVDTLPVDIRPAVMLLGQVATLAGQVALLVDLRSTLVPMVAPAPR